MPLQELEGLIEEQDEYLCKHGAEQKALADHWRAEAERARQFAASARHKEVQARMKFLAVSGDWGDEK